MEYLQHLKEILWNNAAHIAADLTAWMLVFLANVMPDNHIDVTVRHMIPYVQLAAPVLASIASLLTIVKIHVELKRFKKP